jgi:biopolymer transport protein ExbB
MLYEIYETIRELLDRGGDVMVLLAWVVFIMWTLIIERLMFMLTENRIRLKAVLAECESRREQDSWNSQAIYDAFVSQLSMCFESSIELIRTLARLCPLFGLLGTVTGMIVIFDVMAGTGSDSPRAMAAGVAKATLTTMGGMVGALSGIFPAAILSRFALNQRISLQTRCLTSTGVALSPISGLPKTLRWIVAPTAAFFITMGLLFLMQTLIETGEPAIQKVVAAEYFEFIRIRRDERIEMRSEKPTKIMPEETPEMFVSRLPTELEAGGIVIRYPVAVARPASDRMDFVGQIGDFGSPDGEFLPLVRVLPIYPAQALRQKLEGWVIVEFTIAETGAVKNARAVESSHSIFDFAAVRAAEKFKYRPRIHNGIPVAVIGVRVKLTFVMAK